MALSDNLAAGYQLAEASGNALDVLLSNDLTASGSPGSGTGKVGNCRTFNGSSQYFSKADNATLSTGDIDFSGMAWVSISNTSSYPIVGHKGWAASGSNREWVCYYDGGGSARFKFEVGYGASQRTVTANNYGAVSTNTFVLVAFGHNASTNEIWISVNAGTPDTTAHSDGVNDGNGDFVIGASVSQGLYYPGSIDEFYFFKRDIRSDLSSFYNSGSGLAYSSWAGGSPTHYSLTCDYGSFALSGQSASLRVDRKLTAAHGTYAITGQDANLIANRILAASHGAYTITGQAAALTVARKLTAEQGSYTLTGQAAALVAGRMLAAAQGSFTLSGQDAVLRAARRLVAGHGTITITGQDVTLTYSGEAVVVPASITVQTAYRLLQRRRTHTT